MTSSTSTRQWRNSALPPEPTLRAYRLYLAGSAMAFERGWMSLHQVLAAKPSGELAAGAMAGAQSAYPFTRDYIYCNDHP